MRWFQRQMRFLKMTKTIRIRFRAISKPRRSILVILERCQSLKARITIYFDRVYSSTA